MALVCWDTDSGPIKWPNQATTVAQLDCACKHIDCGDPIVSSIFPLTLSSGQSFYFDEKMQRTYRMV